MSDPSDESVRNRLKSPVDDARGRAAPWRLRSR